MWYETFAFVISEAFAAGVPVIASQLGPLADRVHHEIDGLLVPPGDVEALHHALHRLQSEPAFLSQLQAGINPIRTMADHVQDIELVYNEVLSG
jgi:glycosyltransferase involved in cell wall biosynthesis